MFFPGLPGCTLVGDMIQDAARDAEEARLAIDQTQEGSIEAGRGEFCVGKREAVTKALSVIAKDAPANRSKGE